MKRKITKKEKWNPRKILNLNDCSVSPQAAAHLPTFSLVLLLSMTSYGMEHPSGQLGSAVLTMSPPNFLCTTSLHAGGVVWGAEKALNLCEHCSAIAKTSPYYQHFSTQIQKTAPSQLLRRKLTLSHPKPAQWDKQPLSTMGLKFHQKGGHRMLSLGEQQMRNSLWWVVVFRNKLMMCSGRLNCLVVFSKSNKPFVSWNRDFFSEEQQRSQQLRHWWGLGASLTDALSKCPIWKFRLFLNQRFKNYAELLSRVRQHKCQRGENLDTKFYWRINDITAFSLLILSHTPSPPPRQHFIP